MKRLWYIFKEIFISLYYEFISLWKSTDKPREMVGLFFLLSVVFLFTGKYFQANISIGLMSIAYVWKIIKQGRWKERMRKNNIKRLS